MKYNKHLKKYVTPDDGQDYCIKCEGEGTIQRKRNQWVYRPKENLICDRCFGTGVLDWIEKITGKEDRRRSKSTHVSMYS